jgi:hypothetical protein
MTALPIFDFRLPARIVATRHKSRHARNAKLPLLIAGRIHEFEEDEVLQVGKRYLPLLASIGAKAEHGQWLAASNDLNRSDGVEMRNDEAAGAHWYRAGYRASRIIAAAIDRTMLGRRGTFPAIRAALSTAR